MNRYRFGEKATGDRHMFSYSGREDKHEHGVEVLVHEDTFSSVLGFHPIPCRICTIRLRASPFSVTIVQVCAPTSDYDGDQVEHIYDHQQREVDPTPRTDVATVLGDCRESRNRHVHRLEAHAVPT